MSEENRRDSEEAERDIILLFLVMFGSVKRHGYSGEFRSMKLGLKIIHCSISLVSRDGWIDEWVDTWIDRYMDR